MITVDVNTGRHKGGGGSQEQAILAVNTEAVEEVSRQLRLRNIGGLVVIDLIDMKPRKHQQAVYRTMRSALRRDRARTNVLPISDLGLMEMTRQRVEESITSTMHVDCPYCKGRGHVKSPLGMSVDIQRQIAAILRSRREEAARKLQIVVHPTVLERLRREDEQVLVDLQESAEGLLTFKSDPTKHMEFFSILDVDDQEVLYSSTNGQ
jgi:ribonuclease G